MEDLRVKELSEKIGAYECKVKSCELSLQSYRKSLKILKRELKEYLDSKQGNLLEV